MDLSKVLNHYLYRYIQSNHRKTFNLDITNFIKRILAFLRAVLSYAKLSSELSRSSASDRDKTHIFLDKISKTIVHI